MLFARFLAERGLLRNPEYDVPVSLEDCRELAEAEGLTDPWIIAERYAASMLPGVFRIDDPVLSVKLDPMQAQALHRLVTGLDARSVPSRGQPWLDLSVLAGGGEGCG